MRCLTETLISQSPAKRSGYQEQFASSVEGLKSTMITLRGKGFMILSGTTIADVQGCCLRKFSESPNQASNIKN